MTGVMQLGYLGVGVRDLGEWRTYAENTLGLETVANDRDGSLLLRMDDHHHRFALHEDARDDVLYSAWQVDSAADVTAIGDRLEAAGHAVARGTSQEAERRRVQGLIKFQDPDGHDVEVFHGPEMAASAFKSAKGDTKFVADAQGLGHFVLAASDSRPRDGFLHKHARHEGLRLRHAGAAEARFPALQPAPPQHRLRRVPGRAKAREPLHAPARRLRCGGRTWDTVQDGSAPVIMTLGRHSNDEMVSFYMRNPSGFGVEYGWGAREVDDACWEVTEYNTGSWWGHRPAPRVAST